MIVAMALQAAAITAPVKSAPESVSGRAGAAVRAATLAGVAALPPRPVTFRFQCTTDRWGAVEACVEAGGPPLTGRDAMSLRELEEASDRSPRGLWRRAARDRLRLVRAGKGPFGESGGPRRSVWIEETVAASDRPALPPPTGTTVASALVLSRDVGEAPADRYPALALRHGAQAVVAVTCRVMPDRALHCRAPQVVRRSDAPFDQLFEIATIEAFGRLRAAPATTDGRSAIGLEVPMRMNWTLP